MRRRLLTAVTIPVILLVAVFAGMAVSSADYASCGSGSLGSGTGTCCGASGGSGGSGSGGGCYSPGPYPTVPGRLYGVAATSSDDAWAVGLKADSSLIMHWNGGSWAVSPSEPAGYLLGVSATSATDAWAVGGTNWFSPSQTLAEHWDGTSWTRVASPSPGASAVLGGVAAISPTNAWAVGLIGPGPGVPSASDPLIEHWDGSSWSVQPCPGPSDGGRFNAVAATSAGDVWAVGFTGSSSQDTGQATLIEHWDGTSCTHLPSPHPGSASFLQGVAATSPSDAWAVGYARSGGVYESLILHWDGNRWTRVSSPNPTGDTNLRAVAAISRDDAWAVGFTNPTRCGHGPKCATAIFHWDGSTWTVTPIPNPRSSSLNAFLGVVAISGGNAWAVGTTDWASTLIAHWDGSAWN